MSKIFPDSSSIVLDVLTGHDNYLVWSACIKNYLLAQDLWDVIETTTEPPNPEDVVEFKAWTKKNAAALHAIQISCSVNIQAQIGEDDTAKIVWDAFAESYDPKAQEMENSMFHTVERAVGPIISSLAAMEKRLKKIELMQLVLKKTIDKGKREIMQKMAELQYGVVE